MKRYDWIKTTLVLMLLQLTVTTASAQVSENDEMSPVVTMRFGYLSYEAALQSMPDYGLVQQKMAELRDQYQAETKRVEEEFNRKYEAFLEGQRDFPKTILQKRQSELQELMEKNIAFKENSLKELAQTEKEMFAPMKIRLIELLGKIGRQRGYAFIIDTDKQSLPFINPDMGDDINQTVQDALK